MLCCVVQHYDFQWLSLKQYSGYIICGVVILRRADHTKIGSDL